MIPWLITRGWAAVLLGIVGTLATRAAERAVAHPPNVVLIFADDLGFGDLGCYGRRDIRTSHLDRLAREGMRFTDFRVAQAVCSASRAALLTGCLPNRIGILGALFPRSPVGLHPNEVTLGELFQSRGYATAMVGKWHLGDAPAFNPTRHGFDEWLGLPYSNDMWPSHPTMTNFPSLPLMDGTAVVDADITPSDQADLPRRYTERAVQFIRRQGTHPFFLYLAPAMPHVPLFASDRYRGTSAAGLYGDVIEEIDGSVGEVMQALKDAGVERETLVIFTSDNGPWLSYGNHAGVSGGFREGKGTAWEGGVRVPMIANWPGQIAPGTVYSGFATTVDVLPTLAALIQAPLPQARTLDGRNLLGVLTSGDDAPSAEFFFPGYYGADLCSIRSGPWKRVFAHTYQHLQRAGADGLPGSYVREKTGAALYHLGEDPGESRDVAADHAAIVARLEAEAARIREALGDSLQGISGTAMRAPGSASALRVRQDPAGTVALLATNAIVHGVNLRFETDPNGDRLTLWTRAGDWVEWEFDLVRPGRYQVELVQSCAGGSGGAELEFRMNGQVLSFTVPETGTADTFVARTLGVVDFPAAGMHGLEVRTRSDPARGVGDIRQVILRPVP